MLLLCFSAIVNVYVCSGPRRANSPTQTQGHRGRTMRRLSYLLHAKNKPTQQHKRKGSSDRQAGYRINAEASSILDPCLLTERIYDGTLCRVIYVIYQFYKVRQGIGKHYQTLYDSHKTIVARRDF